MPYILIRKGHDYAIKIDYLQAFQWYLNYYAFFIKIIETRSIQGETQFVIYLK
jgi:hypothetical protein